MWDVMWSSSWFSYFLLSFNGYTHIFFTIIVVIFSILLRYQVPTRYGTWQHQVLIIIPDPPVYYEHKLYINTTKKLLYWHHQSKQRNLLWWLLHAHDQYNNFTFSSSLNFFLFIAAMNNKQWRQKKENVLRLKAYADSGHLDGTLNLFS